MTKTCASNARLPGTIYPIIITIVLTIIFPASNLAHAQTNEELGYETVEGTLEDEELGFSLELPDSMEGFVSEFDSAGRRVLTMQIHPEFDSRSSACCPTIDAAPAVFLLTSDLLDTASTPVPLTGDVYAAIQGYDMRMSIEKLGDMQVLAATMHSDNDRFGLDYDNVGKFYFINSDERYLSYGLWASEENYEKYLEAFEESARSLVIENAQPVNLHSMFRHYTYSDIEVQQEDGTVLYPEIITPSIIESVAINEDSNTLQISIDEPSGNSFLILNTGDLLAGPHNITLDGEPIEGTVLGNENGEYLVAYYDESGRHEITITGTAVIPEFGSLAAMLMAAGIVGIVTVTKYMHRRKN